MKASPFALSAALQRSQTAFIKRAIASDAAALGRTATVVRHRRNVADAADLDAGGGECADRGLTAGAGTGDADIDRTDTVVTGCVGCTDGGLLGGKRVPLREPRKPSEPDDFQLSVLPTWSVMVTMVLLNEA